MAGRYIINRTAGKRVIILEEDSEKIEGGYFDTDGEWKELSGPLNDPITPGYVINQTGGKRIILLEEDADEIGGGYFEEDGTWHDFGPSGPFPKTINATDPGIGIFGESLTKPANNPPYTTEALNRVSYMGDSFQGLDIDGSKQYKFTFTNADLRPAFDFVNEDGALQMDNFQSVSSANKKWVTYANLTDNYLIVTPPTINGKPSTRLVMTIKKYDDSNFTDLSEVCPFTIEEV